MSNHPMGTAPGLGGDRQTTLREFSAVIFRRRWLILGLFFVVSATVLVITLATPAMYSSTGRVLVTRGERESQLNGRVQILNDWEQDLASEVLKVRSTEVILRARSRLAGQARRTGRKAPSIDPRRVGVEVMGKSNVLAIGYDDLKPDVAQEVCDAMVTSYVDYRQERPLGVTDSVFAIQLDSLRRQIEARTALRESIAMRSGVNDPLEQTRYLNGELAQLESRHNDVGADLAAARSRASAMLELQQHPEIDMPTLGNETYISDNGLVQLKQKITDQQAHVAILRERYRDDSPDVVNALETLQTLQALLRREVNQRLVIARSRVNELEARLAVHDRDLAEIRAKLATLPQNQKTLDDLDAQIKTLRARNEEFVKARDQARITANVSQSVMVTLLNPAGAAEPKNTRDIVRLLLAPGFSLVVGVGLAFFIDGLDITVRTAGQAEAYLDLPVLATLPERRGRRG